MYSDEGMCEKTYNRKREKIDERTSRDKEGEFQGISDGKSEQST